jgi:hypothetical protein
MMLFFIGHVAMTIRERRAAGIFTGKS